MTRILENPDILRSIFEDSTEGVVIIDDSNSILACNPAMQHIFGYELEELIGKSLNLLLPKRYTNHQSHITNYKAAGKSHIMGYGREVSGMHKNGHEVALEVGVSKAYIDGRYILTGIVRDITERKQAQEELKRLALIDPLTNVYNRNFLYTHLQHTLLEAARYNKHFAILFFDLNRFKMANDKYGHSVGDAILVEFVARIKKSIRSSDVLARTGGDEFILIAPTADDITHAAIAKKILETIQEPFTTENHKIEIGVSIGIALYPHDGDAADILIKNADTAMYQAKTKPASSYVLYSSIKQNDTACTSCINH